jgi:putative membrane protein
MVTTLLAEAGWAGGHAWFLIFPLLWIGLFVTLILMWRGRWGYRGGSTSAEDVLADRFARGEISADEYRQRLDVLHRT